MSEPEIKLSYNAAMKAVRLNISIGACLKHMMPPMVYVEKAEEKMKREMENGNIDQYHVFKERYEDLWISLRMHPLAQSHPEQRIEFSVAAGVKGMSGIEITPASEDKVAFHLTIHSSPEDVAAWQWEMVKVFFILMQKQLEITQMGNWSQVMSAWILRKRGKKVNNVPIFMAPTPRDNVGDKDYSIITNKRRRELSLVIYRPDVLMEKAKLDLMFHSSAGAVEKINKTLGWKAEFLRMEFFDRLRSAANGIEKYGLELPCAILIGVCPDAESHDASVQTKGVEADAPGNALGAPAAKGKKTAIPVLQTRHPGWGIMKIELMDDNLRACIRDFDRNVYKNTKVPLDRKWIENEAKRLGIKIGLRDENVEKILMAIMEEADLSGILLAEGIAPVKAEGPYLHDTYKDVKTIEASDKGASLSLKDRQAANIVKKGQLVAEIRFNVPEVVGKNVFGKNIIPPRSYEGCEVNAQSGVTGSDDGKYYSTEDGMIAIENNVINISPTLVHKGDVNLKSGNISFAGAATIEGSIETGAVVMISGDLTVIGSIGAAFVSVGGNLHVSGGIVTGLKGSVRVKGSIETEFIGNSNVICSGNIKAKKSILNSTIVCGGGVEVDGNDGVLAGGSLSCRDNIMVGRLGLPNGDLTECEVGGDWMIQNALKIKSARLKKVEEIAEEDRKQMRELVRKKEAQLTKGHRAYIEKLKQRTIKARKLIEALKLSLDEKRRAMSWKKDSSIYIRMVLSTNVSLCVGGKKVPVTHEVVEVVVTSDKKRGSHINPLEEKEAAS